MFTNFSEYLGDEEASAGLVKCGYLIAAPDGNKLEPLRASIAGQIAQGIEVKMLDRKQASELLPIAQFDDAAVIDFEPEAGFADAYMVATSFARGARPRGVVIKEGVTVNKLVVQNGKLSGIAGAGGHGLTHRRFTGPVFDRTFCLGLAVAWKIRRRRRFLRKTALARGP